MHNPCYSIVIPVYNSCESLEELYERINTVFSDIDGEYELIMVEDCSSDDSWEVLKALRRRDSKVKIIQLMRNSGQHSALMCGFHFAQGDFLITMDDDLQHPPEEIPKLIRKMQESNYDVICGYHNSRKHPHIRNIGSFLFCRLMSIHDYPGFMTGSYRIIKKEVVKCIIRHQSVKPLVDILLHRVTGRIGYMEIEHHKRKYGHSTYTFKKLVRHFFNAITYDTTLPLRLVFSVGLFCFFSCFIIGVVYLIRYMQGKITVSGWTTLLLLILLSFGVLSLFIGIIGQYLYRVIDHLGHAQPFQIREKEL